MLLITNPARTSRVAAPRLGLRRLLPLLGGVVLGASFGGAGDAWALNKQGVAAGVSEQAPSEGLLGLSGYLFTGAMVYNPSYAARPDNSGLALMRTGLHLDFDLFRKYLTVSYDGNVFSDRRAGNPIRPSEHDHIIGLLTRFGDLELGIHYEMDLPGDRAGEGQSYLDAHLRYYFDLFDAFPAWRRALPRQGLSGYLTFAGFLQNGSYAARPDLTGLALFRWVAHLDVDLLRPWLTLSLDFNLFTDRRGAAFAASELDTTVGLVLHLGRFDVSLVAENDRPVDRGGLSQSYVSLMLSYRFELGSAAAKSAPPLRRLSTNLRAPDLVAAP